MAKRSKTNESEKSAMEEEIAELKNKIIKLHEEKTELSNKLSEKTDKLLEKTEECGKLKLKVKEMETKMKEIYNAIMKLNEPTKKTMKGVYEENYNVLRWIEITVDMSRQKPMIVTPQSFMEYLADGFMLCRLASVLGEDRIDAYPTDKKKRYEYFYKFAKEKAKMAEECIFREEELFGKTDDNFISVFSTLFKLANQSKDKFNKKALWEID